MRVVSSLYNWGEPERAPHELVPGCAIYMYVLYVCMYVYLVRRVARARAMRDSHVGAHAV